MPARDTTAPAAAEPVRPTPDGERVSRGAPPESAIQSLDASGFPGGYSNTHGPGRMKPALRQTPWTPGCRTGGRRAVPCRRGRAARDGPDRGCRHPPPLVLRQHPPGLVDLPAVPGAAPEADGAHRPVVLHRLDHVHPAGVAGDPQVAPVAPGELLRRLRAPGCSVVPGAFTRSSSRKSPRAQGRAGKRLRAAGHKGEPRPGRGGLAGAVGGRGSRQRKPAN
jgi:hypothetical protein